MLLAQSVIDYLLFEGYQSEIQTLAMYAIGISIYGLFVYFFYETLSRRNLLGERWQDADFGPLTLVWRAIRYVFLFPIVTFLFFMVLAASFLFFSAAGQIAVDQATFVNQVLLISMAIVTSVRITAYISQPTSHDIAKLLPLGMLAVFIVGLNMEADVIRETIRLFQEFVSVEILTGVIARYFLFLILLEGALRLIYLTVRPTDDGDEPEEPARTPKPHRGDPAETPGETPEGPIVEGVDDD